MLSRSSRLLRLCSLVLALVPPLLERGEVEFPAFDHDDGQAARSGVCKKTRKLLPNAPGG